MNNQETDMLSPIIRRAGVALAVTLALFAAPNPAVAEDVEAAQSPPTIVNHEPINTDALDLTTAKEEPTNAAPEALALSEVDLSGDIWPEPRWEIAKTVDAPTGLKADEASAEPKWTITVTELEKNRELGKVGGSFTIHNPNTELRLDVGPEVIMDKSSCQYSYEEVGSGVYSALLPGGTFEMKPNSRFTVSIECWVQGLVSNTVDAQVKVTVVSAVNVVNPSAPPVDTSLLAASHMLTITMGEETLAPQSVTITDTQYTFAPAWIVTEAAPGTVSTRTYTTHVDVAQGECVDPSNTATIVEKSLSADASTKICRDKPTSPPTTTPLGGKTSPPHRAGTPSLSKTGAADMTRLIVVSAALTLLGGTALFARMIRRR